MCPLGKPELPRTVYSGTCAAAGCTEIDTAAECATFAGALGWPTSVATETTTNTAPKCNNIPAGQSYAGSYFNTNGAGVAATCGTYGAACACTCPATTPAKISSGTCAMYGCYEVTTAAECADAASALGWATSVATETTTNTAARCNNIPAGQSYAGTYFNTNLVVPLQHVVHMGLSLIHI